MKLSVFNRQEQRTPTRTLTLRREREIIYSTSTVEMRDINEEEKDMRLIVIVKIRDLPIVEENKLTMSEKSRMNNNLIFN